MADDLRVYLFGGKGGVGKTTMSGACALYLARKGIPTLLISTDPAHSLSDLFSENLGPQPKETAPRLYALELDPQSATLDYIKRASEVAESLFGPDLLRSFRDMMDSVKEDPALYDYVVIDILAQIILVGAECYGAVVIDTAPTGHTLMMIRAVSHSGKWLESLIRNRLKAQKLKKMAGKDTPDRITGILEERRKRLQAFGELLFSERTLFVPVMIPERLSIEETKRLISSLNKQGIKVRKLVVNKVLPPQPGDPFLVSRKEQERAYLEEIEKTFSGFEIIHVPLLERDVHGVERIEKLLKYAEAVVG